MLANKKCGSWCNQPASMMELRCCDLPKKRGPPVKGKGSTLSIPPSIQHAALVLHMWRRATSSGRLTPGHSAHGSAGARRRNWLAAPWDPQGALGARLRVPWALSTRSAPTASPLGSLGSPRLPLRTLRTLATRCERRAHPRPGIAARRAPEHQAASVFQKPLAHFVQVVWPSPTRNSQGIRMMNTQKIVVSLISDDRLVSRTRGLQRKPLLRKLADEHQGSPPCLTAPRGSMGLEARRALKACAGSLPNPALGAAHAAGCMHPPQRPP